MEISDVTYQRTCIKKRWQGEYQLENKRRDVMLQWEKVINDFTDQELEKLDS